MANGRPPKPDALKRKLGTFQQCRARPILEVVPDGARPAAMPSGLRKRGKEAWRQYTSLGAEWIAATDRATLERLCRLYDEEVDLYRLVKKHGYVIRGTLGGMVANPAVVSLRKTQELITRLEGLCGFNPSDRTRLGLTFAQAESKFDELMRKRAETAAQ